MDNKNAISLHNIPGIVQQLAQLHEHLTELLGGFKLYNEYKGHLDIEIYEQSLSLYVSCINAMEEQINNLQHTINKLEAITQADR